MTERIPYKERHAEMGVLRKGRGVTLRDKVRSCEIRKALNFEAPAKNREIPSTFVRPCLQNVPSIDWRS